MTDVKDVLAAAIEFEKFGVEYYMRFRDMVEDDKAKPLMKGLADDEREHANILERELKALGGKMKTPSKTDVEKGLREIFPEASHKGSIATKDAISALKLGIRTEERSIEFYTKNANVAGPGLRTIFEKLAKMERGHRELLAENMKYLEDDGSWYGYLPLLD